MYTQCPACLTTFKVASEQIAACGGKVRCGICSAVFQAKQRLLPIPSRTRTPPGPSSKKSEAQRKGKGKRAAKKPRATQKSLQEEIDSLDENLVAVPDIPIITQQPQFGYPRPGMRVALAGLAILTLVVLLAGQFVYFYRNELASLPAWRPYLADLCEQLECTLQPMQDIARIELLESSIAPHPKYQHALRLRASLVNRAAFHQAYPSMEVTLTSGTGKVISRRTFSPIQYADAPLEGALSPNVVTTARLDITNPNDQAVGYEIRLVTH